MNYIIKIGRWFRNSRKKVFIFGYGRIGRRVAEILNFLNAHVYIVDPYIKSIESKYNLANKDQALNYADIITIHSSGDEEIINENDFSNLKKEFICAILQEDIAFLRKV